MTPLLLQLSYHSLQFFSRYQFHFSLFFFTTRILLFQIYIATLNALLFVNMKSIVYDEL